MYAKSKSQKEITGTVFSVEGENNKKKSSSKTFNNSWTLIAYL